MHEQAWKGLLERDQDFNSVRKNYQWRYGVLPRFTSFSHRPSSRVPHHTSHHFPLFAHKDVAHPASSAAERGIIFIRGGLRVRPSHQRLGIPPKDL